LEEIDVNGNAIGDEGALSLAGSPHLTLSAERRLGMAGLLLHENPVGAAGREALRARFGTNVAL
jgi:hypothetical protein